MASRMIFFRFWRGFLWEAVREKAPSRKITLRSSDGKSFKVEQSVAVQSETIKHMIEDDCADDVIPLPNVTSKILAMVIKYCKKHVESAEAEDRVNDEDLEAWDAKFVKADLATLVDLVMAANYLNITSLLELVCRTLADNTLKGKTAEEIRKTWGFKNDFTPEEQEEMRREPTWTFVEEPDEEDEEDQWRAKDGWRGEYQWREEDWWRA